MKQLDKYKLLFEKESGMIVDVVAYVDNRIMVEDEALRQLKNAARIPGVRRVIATPDIHTGFGVPIGSIVAIKDNIVPSAVGYDVNCGMRVITTPLFRENIDPKALAESIRRDLPLGEGKRNVNLSKDDLKIILEKGLKGLREIAHRYERLSRIRNEEEEYNDILKTEESGSMSGNADAVSRRAIERGHDQLGTLGGGNHFCEIQFVEEIYDNNIAKEFGIEKNQIVIMLHSGSRGLGHQIGDDYMNLARTLTGDISPSKSLGFLPLKENSGRDYVSAMHCAANYAFVNRQIMTMFIRKNFRHYFGDIPMPIIYDVPHNIAKFENYEGENLCIHRKGATRAFPANKMRGTVYERIGQPVIIPGSMGTASYLLIGEDKAIEALYSVCHGSGRAMSRTRAGGKVKRKDGRIIEEGAISDERFRESMQGIVLICEDKYHIKEEAPDAYKDIDVVIDIVVKSGLAKAIARMKPLAVLKG